ncbi:protein YIF1B-B-like [Corticium candelabrum]|uniref:protein YIF1B-B-like n=1 Tax=Corticium candelabrum TaxID=121492 RepID=UPI002E269412|nr:protein YIF1B-B-like [Corticium candelabrum]
MDHGSSIHQRPTTSYNPYNQPSGLYNQPHNPYGQHAVDGGYPNPQLFEDTSGHGGVPFPPGNQMFADPMASVAVQYGSHLAGVGREMVDQKVSQFISTSKLKYYFAVDTPYVLKKLGLLLFPFHHTNWAVRYNKSEPIVPRYEINAPDLYVPVMAFVTYILVVGLALGMQNRFSPEQLGIAATSAFVWLFLEIGVIVFALYLFHVTTDLLTLDLIAFCGYKYVHMIVTLLGGILFGSYGYYGFLIWTSLSISYFLVRTLRRSVLPATGDDGIAHASKRRNWLLLSITLMQPFFVWWLTSHVLTHQTSINSYFTL